MCGEEWGREGPIPVVAVVGAAATVGDAVAEDVQGASGLRGPSFDSAEEVPMEGQL